MREIKFRAWDKCKKEMVDAFCLVSTIPYWSAQVYEEPNEIVRKFLIKTQDETGHYTLIDTSNQYGHLYFEIMQYTGLKDRKGIEIYEGDIIKDDADDIGVVCYSGASYVLKESIANESGWFLWDSEPLEVIGTIYENPELLESK